MSWVEGGRASPALSTIKCLDRGKKKRPAKLVEPVCRSASLLPCYLVS